MVQVPDHGSGSSNPETCLSHCTHQGVSGAPHMQQQQAFDIMRSGPTLCIREGETYDWSTLTIGGAMPDWWTATESVVMCQCSAVGAASSVLG